MTIHKKRKCVGIENMLEIISIVEVLYVDSLDDCYDRQDDDNALKACLNYSNEIN